MKVCIVGAGAIGGFIGAKLAASARADVCALARGATLTALRAHGWRVRREGELLQAPALAFPTAGEAGPQDLVIVAVKGASMTDAARSLGPLLGPETLVMPAMNGVPWWFGAGVSALGDAPLRSIDPDGSISAAIAFERVVGCVVHASAALVEPGLVEHKTGERLIVGEARGGHSARVQRVADLLQSADFEVTHSDDIRRDIWYKLWGNLSMNPITALTGATGDQVLADPLVREVCSNAMREAAAIGRHIGCPIDQTPEDRHAITAKLGVLRTSMLQDAEAGRPLELDAIVGAVRELGQRLGLPTPWIDSIFGLARLFARVHGLYPLERTEASAR